MESKIHSTIVITSILAFALIATVGIPAAFVSVLAQGEGGGTGGMTNENGGMTTEDGGMTTEDGGMTTEDGGMTEDTGRPTSGEP